MAHWSRKHAKPLPAGHVMWLGSVHNPELLTGSGKQRSQPTSGRLLSRPEKQRSASEQTTDRFHSHWRHAAFQANRSFDPTTNRLRQPDRRHDVHGNANTFYRRREICSNASHSPLVLNRHWHDHSARNLPSAMRNHMSRGQRTSQSATRAQIVGPSRACSFLSVNELSGRPVAEIYSVDTPARVKKIVSNSAKRILDSNFVSSMSQGPFNQFSRTGVSTMSSEGPQTALPEPTGLPLAADLLAACSRCTHWSFRSASLRFDSARPSHRRSTVRRC